MRFKITSLQFSIIIIISRVQIVAAILWLQFMVQVMLLLLLPSSFLFHSSLARFQRVWFTDQSLLIHYSTKNVLIIRHVISITTFCMRICRPGRRFSSFQLPCDLTGIIYFVDSTNSMILVEAVFSCLILVSWSFRSVYFWSLSVMGFRGCDC